MFKVPIPILPTTSMFVSLSNDNFVDLPVSICNASNLLILDLSNNQISGSIPPCLGKLINLNILDLSKNKFHGSMPQNFGNICCITTLNLNGNLVEGLVPRSLANCRHLEILDLGNNQINDTFPFWLESLEELQVLILQSNRFLGTITNTPRLNMNSFPRLHIIDISSNNFTGHLPLEYLRSSKEMTTVNEGGDKDQVRSTYADGRYHEYSLMVANKGQELRYNFKIVYILNAIDLSSNKFEGEIPESVGDFKSIQVLNLSHNSLVGKIPSSLGNLRELQSLDFSSNNLLGEIPSELTKLTFLSVLNLSWNHLVGRIPTGAQFDTFSSSSFEGNLGLCGSQLDIECNQKRDNVPSLSGEKHNLPHQDSKTSFDWTFALAGYGSGIVMGVVVVHFLLSRNAYYLAKVMQIRRFIQDKRSQRIRH